MFVKSLALLLVSHPHQGGADMLSLLVVGSVAAIAIAVLIQRVRATGRALVATQGKLDDLSEQHKSTQEKQRKADKDLDGKRDDIRKLKNDLAAQRKKSHAAQEETRKLRDDLKTSRKAFDEERIERKAFDKSDEIKVAPVVEKKKAVPEAEAAPTKGVTLKEMKQSLEDLRGAESALKEQLTTERDKGHKNLAELKELRRRVEGYRRIDMITSGRFEVLEDRLNNLGRQYYEAVTEIAVLKGEVPDVAKMQAARKAATQMAKENLNVADFEAVPEAETLTADEVEQSNASTIANPPEDQEPTTATAH